MEFIIKEGRLGADSEIKYLPNGMALTELSVASSKKWKDKNNEWQETTSWFKLSAWNKEYRLKKGEMVRAEGNVSISKKDDTYFHNYEVQKLYRLDPVKSDSSKENDSPKEFQKAAPTKELKDDVPF
jgi:single-strand DNA-binding protein